MAKSRITIVVDDETGDAEVRSPVDMPDDDVLDILTLAVDATADRIASRTQEASDQEEAIHETLKALPDAKKEYFN